jgi:hypothetical protein
MPPSFDTLMISAPKAFITCPPLGAHVLGHDQHHAQPPHGRGHGQGDAGVAAGGLDQGVAALDLAPLLGLHDHVQGRAVLDRARGVVALELGEDAVAGLPGHALELHQRCVADEVLQASRLQAACLVHINGCVHRVQNHESRNHILNNQLS